MNRVLSLLLMVVFFSNLVGNAITPLLSNYVLTIGGKVSDAGIAYAILTWVAAITLIVSPKIKKRYQISDKTFLYVSYLASVLAPVWYLYLTSIEQFYIMQALLAIFGAMSIPVTFKWYQLFLKDSFATRGWGMHKAMIALSSGIASVIASHLIVNTSYKHVFYFTLGSAIVAVLILMVTMHFYYADTPQGDLALKGER
jgi:MFS family permease